MNEIPRTEVVVEAGVGILEFSVPVEWFDEEPEEALPCFPKTRNECLMGPRPCPWLRCKHHMFWVATNMNDRPTSKESMRNADQVLKGKSGDRVLKKIWDLPQTCSMDVIESGPHPLEVVGNAIGVTRERVRQIQERALRKLAHISRARFLFAFWADLSEREVDRQ